MSRAATPKYTLYGFEPASGRHELIRALTAEGEILTPAKTRQLRRALYEDEVLGRAEAEALIALERTQRGRACPEWTAFFVEILTDHLVWRARPAKLIDHERAEWLIAQADAAPTSAIHALLANVLAEARRAPGWFVEAARARIAPAPAKAARV